VESYGVTRPYQVHNYTINQPIYTLVHYFNDIWSLDDV
jgi:hypothetical protein